MIRDPLEIFLFGKYFLVLQAWVKSQDRTPRNEFRISILFNVHTVPLSGHYKTKEAVCTFSMRLQLFHFKNIHNRLI